MEIYGYNGASDRYGGCGSGRAKTRLDGERKTMPHLTIATSGACRRD
jgi:hypothetical protein